MAFGDGGGDKDIPLLDLDRNDASFSDVGKVSEVRLLHDAATGGEEDMLLGVPSGLDTSCTTTGRRLDAECGSDLLSGLEVEDVGD